MEKKHSQKNLNKDSSVEVCIAVGLSVLWETEMAYNFDNIDVTTD